MPSKRLTAPALDHLKTDKAQEDFWDTMTAGFGVRVTRGGRKTFVILPRILHRGEWKKKRFTLGRYPDLELGEARKRAKDAIAVATDGGDPLTVIKPAPHVEKVKQSADCFANVRDEFLRRYRTRQRTRPRPRTLEEMRRCISGSRFTDWDDKPVAEITKQDVRDVLDEIIDDGHDAHANKTLTVLKMLFNWAFDHDKVEDVPTDRIKPPGAESSRERTLTGPELAAIWKAANGENGGVYGDIVRALMLTGQRRNEVGQMQWSEINFDRRLWEIPASRTKNKRPHVIPLSSAVLVILRRQRKEQEKLPAPCPFVFTTNGKKPFSDGVGRSSDSITAPASPTGDCMTFADRW